MYSIPIQLILLVHQSTHSNVDYPLFYRSLQAAVRNATDEARSRMDEARDAANKDITTDTSTMRTTATITGRDAEPPLVQKLADRIGGEVDKVGPLVCTAWAWTV